jgi:hypothetical protein
MRAEWRHESYIEFYRKQQNSFKNEQDTRTKAHPAFTRLKNFVLCPGQFKRFALVLYQQWYHTDTNLTESSARHKLMKSAKNFVFTATTTSELFFQSKCYVAKSVETFVRSDSPQVDKSPWISLTYRLKWFWILEARHSYQWNTIRICEEYQNNNVFMPLPHSIVINTLVMNRRKKKQFFQFTSHSHIGSTTRFSGKWKSHQKGQIPFEISYILTSVTSLNATSHLETEITRYRMKSLCFVFDHLR